MTTVPSLVVNTPLTAGFFGRRWRGEVHLSKLYWRDLLIFGSVINLFTGFFALMIAAQGGDLWSAATVHFACLPYNVFLVLMVWTSLVWLGAVTVCEEGTTGWSSSLETT